MSKNGFIRSEMDSKINRLGKVQKWEELKDTKKEYWTSEAVRKRDISEQYPKNEAETEEEYQARLKKIGEYAITDRDVDTSPVLGKIYSYGSLDSEGRPLSVDKNGRVKGYKFEEYSPNAGDYNEVFAERMAEQGIADAVADEIKARDEGKLVVTTATPKIFESQKDIARYYVGPLDYREQTKNRGKFQDAGTERYTEEDRIWTNKEKRKFLSYDQGSDKIEYLINGKMFEGFFYPLIRYGFFDSDSKSPAAAVLPSEYDDFKGKVDIAVAVPILTGGETTTDHQLLGFDLTTGYGNGKIGRLKDNLDKMHGLTNLKYPSTCFKKEIAPIKNVPHFALCLPPSEFGKFRENLAGGKLPTTEIQDLINFQIYAQADYWARYWHRQDNSKDNAQKFKNIASHFLKRIGLDSKGGAEYVVKLQQKHPEAVRYIYELGIL